MTNLRRPRLPLVGLGGLLRLGQLVVALDAPHHLYDRPGWKRGIFPAAEPSHPLRCRSSAEHDPEEDPDEDDHDDDDHAGEVPLAYLLLDGYR